MSKLEIFKPEDFEPSLRGEFIRFDIAAKIANSKLQEYIEKNGVKLVSKGWDTWSPACKMPTHTAILINIEPIKKKCERHYPVLSFNRDDLSYQATYELNQESICKHCGVKLKAEWKEAE